MSILLSVLSLWLFALSYDVDVGPRWGPRVFAGALAVTYAVVGALIGARQPRNLVGWLFCGVGLCFGILAFSDEYAAYALLKAPGTLPAGMQMAWLSNWIWIPPFSLAIAFLPLLFPAGHLPSRRWRPVAWMAASASIIVSVFYAFTPGPLGNFGLVVNPFGIEQFGGTLPFVFGVFTVAILAIALASALSLVRRTRRSVGVERQQLKWFGFAVGLLIPSTLAGNTVPTIGPPILIAALLGIPIATGIAILRYRLYDIDLLIRRTLVYSALTAMLALVYFGSIVLLQQSARALTGQQQNEIVTVVSTLAIAALFVPLRQRIQNTIDRRLYRRKYDAARVLAQFAATARDEVDLNRLSEQLRAVVDETMQPTQVSLWLKPSAGQPQQEMQSERRVTLR
ncbi:MAG: hypothetical protein LC737_00460 [Chloroflexi bacterium]|nr:hypothetical protein [Chloroflexota bacterium]